METENIVECAQCGSKNRVNAGTVDRVPVCGKCKNPLPWIVTATDASFSSDISGSVPVLVDFWAEWCGPCRMVAPVLEEIAREQAGKVKIAKLNVDQNPVTASQFQVRSIPTMILFKNGSAVETLIGAMGKTALLNRIGGHLIEGSSD